MSDGRIHGYGQQNRTHESRDRTNDATDVSNHDAPFFALSKSCLSPEVKEKTYSRLTEFVHRSVHQLLKVAQRECGENIQSIREQAKALIQLMDRNVSSKSISSYSHVILEFQKEIYKMRGAQCSARLRDRLNKMKIFEEDELAA